jgi:radical SAM enzyme (TIGR01210 family)
MTHKYYPLSDSICHHFYNAGGCLFCGYNIQQKTVSKEPVSLEGMISHFDKYAEENLSDIEKQGRLVVVPNGSWFTEVPKELRKHIYEFVDANMIPLLKYECRASLFTPEKAKAELGEEGYAELRAGLREIKPNHIVSLGLEVADDKDLETLNKGCSLEDYLKASKYIHGKGAKLCCNILLSPPYVEDPIRKAFKTAKYAAEVLKTDEFLIMPCIPMKGAYSYKDWKEGKWNPISATAASEIYRRIVQEYPLIRGKYNSMRIFNFHGRYGEFKRLDRKWSEEEKRAEREKVKKLADEIFK